MCTDTKDHLELVYWIVSTLILIATVYAIYYGPITAVKIGRNLDNEYNKVESKKDLFLTLFAFRGNPVHVEFVNALNQIDVVFEDNPDVLSSWHRYFAALHQLELVNQLEVWNLHRVDLLSRMANCLGYKSLEQTDIMQHYYPAGHQYQINDQQEFRELQRNFYRSGNELNELLISKSTENDQNQ